MRGWEPHAHRQGPRRRGVDGYVARFDATDPKIALKRDHTLRVAALAEQIAATVPELAAPEDVDLAWLLGLLHDVGRFEQVRHYGTFSDADSTSHALLGAKVLFDGLDGAAPTIRDYVDDASEDNLLRTAVSLHSSWRLPPDLSARTRALCEVLRDADKADILKVNCTSPVEDIYPFGREALLKSVAFAGGHVVVLAPLHHSARCAHHPADVLLGHVCFAWELAYPESLRIVARQGYVFQMMERPWVRDDTRREFVRMEDELKGYMREKGVLPEA